MQNGNLSFGNPPGVLRAAALALVSVLLIPGIANAKKQVESDVGCVIFPTSEIYTGFPFTIKIVRDPAYTGVWSQPMVDAEAVFTTTTGGKVSTSYSESSPQPDYNRYGVTYVTATMLAPPSCSEKTCAIEIDTSVDVEIKAVIKEPINKGKRVRETVCDTATAPVNPSM